MLGTGPSSDDLFDIIRTGGGIDDASLRQRLARCWTEKEILALLDRRMFRALASGREPGPEFSIRKGVGR